MRAFNFNETEKIFSNNIKYFLKKNVINFNYDYEISKKFLEIDFKLANCDSLNNIPYYPILYIPTGYIKENENFTIDEETPKNDLHNVIIKYCYTLKHKGIEIKVVEKASMTNKIKIDGYINVYLNFFVPSKVNYNIEVNNTKRCFEREFDIRALAKEIINCPIAKLSKPNFYEETYEKKQEKFSSYIKEIGLEGKVKDLKYYVDLVKDDPEKYDSTADIREVEIIKLSDGKNFNISACKRDEKINICYENPQFSIAFAKPEYVYSACTVVHPVPKKHFKSKNYTFYTLSEQLEKDLCKDTISIRAILK